jgi:hypothetical protein
MVERAGALAEEHQVAHVFPGDLCDLPLSPFLLTRPFTCAVLSISKTRAGPAETRSRSSSLGHRGRGHDRLE